MKTVRIITTAFIIVPPSVCLLGLALVMFACHRSEEYTAIKRIINNTPYQIDIRVFGDDVKYQATIKPFDTLNISGHCEGEPYEGCNIGWPSTLAFSEIVFDQEKVLHLQNDCAAGAASIRWDPTQCAGYERRELVNDTWIFTYRITTADYDAATPING